MISVSPRRKGFTLIELLTVIATIAILTTNAFAGFFDIMRSSRKNSALNKLRSIGQGYISWAQGGKVMTRTGTWTPAGNVATKTSEYAANLAAGAALDSAGLWFVEGDSILDPKFISSLPPRVIRGTGDDASIEPLFLESIASAKGTSWTVYANTSARVVGSVSVPLAWTRGLNDSGLWSPADGTVKGSVWGAEGGHIVYGDGHVSWCSDTLVTGQNYFTDSTGAPTANWQKSLGVPATAQALPQQ